MGMRPLKSCTRCHTVAERGSRFCLKHQNADAIRDREYKAASPTRKLKDTKRWEVVRRHILARDPICTGVVNGVPCPRLSEHVHHKINAEKFVAAGGDYFDMENLAGLCPSCHSRETSKEVGFAGWNKNG
jgi:5-methylcytosine-specific restriction enzyme A